MDGHQFHIEIYLLEDDAKWTLEAIDNVGASIVWDDQFDTDQAALDELLTDIEKQGIVDDCTKEAVDLVVDDGIPLPYLGPCHRFQTGWAIFRRRQVTASLV